MEIVIKRFIDKIENMTNDAWLAILNYVDTKIDDHDNRLTELENKFDEIEDTVNKTKAIIDSNTELSKTIKKTSITVIIGAVISYVLTRLGIL